MYDVASEAVRLAEYGLYPIPLHRPLPGGGCTCGASSCSKQSWGKHPVKKAWAKSVTQDIEILSQDFDGRNVNVGIVLGPCHGIPAEQAIIDVEDDSKDGRRLAERLFNGVECPCYSSGKSIHRLFRWSTRLPPVAKLTIDGLEFRMGGHGKETQSAAPPSLHASGAFYEWLPGMSLGDVRISALPESVIAFILNGYAQQNSKTSPSSSDHRKFLQPGQKITHPGRHDALLRYCNQRWREMFKTYGINGIEEQEVIDTVYTMIHGANLVTCAPPKTPAEVDVIFRSSQQFMLTQFHEELRVAREERTTQDDGRPDLPEAANQESSFGDWLRGTGIQLVPDPTMDFGMESPNRLDRFTATGWQMNYLKGEQQLLIELHLPGIEKPLVMDTLTFDCPRTFATLVHTLTSGEYVLNRTWPFWDWKAIWQGRPNGRARGVTTGLREYLTTRATVTQREDPGLASQLEDLIIQISGNREQLTEALEEWNVAMPTSPFIGRLKINPTGNLCRFAAPEDPKTGYYVDDTGELGLWVKFSELCRLFRSSFGGGVNDQDISDALVQIGLTHVNPRRGPMSGRWWKKNFSNSVGDNVDNAE